MNGISPITPSQWRKVFKALVYSFGAGFFVGFFTSLSGILTNMLNGMPVSFGKSLLVGVVIAGMVGGVNSLMVAFKQLFTTPS